MPSLYLVIWYFSISLFFHFFVSKPRKKGIHKRSDTVSFMECYPLNVRGDSGFAFLLSKPYWSVGVFFFHSPKSLSLHQFILICLLLKPGTRHVLFLVVGVSRLASLMSFPAGFLLGGKKRLFISNQVLLSSPTHLLYSPLLHFLHLFLLSSICF